MMAICWMWLLGESNSLDPSMRTPFIGSLERMRGILIGTEETCPSKKDEVKPGALPPFLHCPSFLPF
jgi:hypothetical protein